VTALRVREQHEALGWVPDQATLPLQEVPPDERDRYGVELVVRQRSAEHLASQSFPLKAALEDLDSRLLPGPPQNVLRAARVPFDDRHSEARELLRERHAPDGEHSHRPERQRKERHFHPKELPVASAEVRPRSVLDGSSSAGKGKRGVDHDEFRARRPSELYDLSVRMEHRRPQSTRPVHHARARVPLG